jgi:hypothetical protein
MLFGLLGGLLMTSTGCGLFQAVFCYRPCVMRGDCGGMCGDDCDDGCGPVCGPRRARGCGDCGDDGCPDCGRPLRASRCRSCGSCGDCGGDPCADPCGDGCYARPWHRGPLSCLFALFTPSCWGGRTCGQRYWGDFYSDPPDCWDPCDCNGNYSGGCRNCGGGQGRPSGYTGGYVNGGDEDGVTTSGDRVISDRVVGQGSQPAAQPHRAPRPHAE